MSEHTAMAAVNRSLSITCGTTESKTESTYISHYPKLLDFEAKYRQQEEKGQSARRKLSAGLKNKVKSCNLKHSLLTLFPVVETVLHYDVKEYLPNDLIAGLTSGVVMIPQGMAYAALSTLPPIVGLYISLFASLTYFVFGTSKQVSYGCIAILSLMMANILDRYDNSDEGLSFVGNSTLGAKELYETHQNDRVTNRRIEVAGSVSVFAGIVFIVASRFGLSRITALMSNSLFTGFTVGVCIYVVMSQFKSILGLSIKRYSGIGQAIRTWVAIWEHLPETNVAVLIISLISMLNIYLVKRFINEKFRHWMRIPIPIEIFVVIISIIISYYAEFHKKYNVPIVGKVPTGLPTPRLPDMTLVADYIGDALMITAVSYAQSLAMAKTMGLKHNYDINANQEMLASGACSVVCGLFSGYITGASISRTVIQDSAGGKTQVASLFAAGLVFLVIMVIGPYFYYLPTCVLAVIIVINLRIMFMKVFLIPNEWEKSRYDCAVLVFACFSTIILNPDLGLLTSVLFSLLLVVFRSMINPVEEVGQIQTNITDVQLRSIPIYCSIKKFSHVKLIKIKTPLYFFNSDTFVSEIFKITGVNPMKIKALQQKEKSSDLKDANKHEQCNGKTSVKTDSNMENGECCKVSATVKGIILDISEMAFIDLMGVSALELLIKEYSSVGIEFLITSVPENVFGILKSTNFWNTHGHRLFLTAEDAVVMTFQQDSTDTNA